MDLPYTWCIRELYWGIRGPSVSTNDWKDFELEIWKVQWKNKLKLVNAELRSLPGLGIDYFQAQEHFYSQNDLN